MRDLETFFRRVTSSPVADAGMERHVLGRLFPHFARTLDSVLAIKHNRARGMDHEINLSGHEHFSPARRHHKSDALKRLGYILRQNTTLKALTIFGGRIAIPGLWFCVGLQCNTSIVEIKLWNVDIHGPAAGHALCEFITGNNALEKLDLSSSNLAPMDIWQLSYALMHRSSNALREIGLGHNHVGDNCMQMLVLGLLNNRGVKRLSLAHTNASGKAVLSLSWLLGKNETALEELNLSGNSIDTCDALKLLKSLETNDKLKTMNLVGNPLCWEIILHRLLTLVCDASSVSAAPLSNHALASIAEPRKGESEEVIYALNRGQIPMKELCHSSLGEDDANLLFASLDLNHKVVNVSAKTRHKTLWRLARGDLYASEASIDIALMPRVLALIGRGYASGTHCESCQKASAKLVQYQEVSEPHALHTVRLETVYRAVRAWPELCFDKGAALHACQRRLAQAEVEVERLRLELKKLRSQVQA
ncbi:hypothetical protein ACHAXT_011105 [Thalassiosira profunda]